MPDLTIEAELSDDEIDRIARGVTNRSDKASDILARMIMAARCGDDAAFDAAKAEGEAFLGIGGGS
ncbi:MAG: hypothetical protein VX874_15785 [Pseudomonadota bacterium]|nr:hypothetical protein [Pseudomonadota bacterium]